MPLTLNVTSEKPSFAPWFNRLLGLLFPVPSSLGVLLYNATLMASSSVVLPDPVGPVMANRDVLQRGSDVKSRCTSPLKLLIFLRRRDNIFNPRPPQSLFPAVH